ncbi:hypothetical protein [Rhizobium mesosinicum]|uniref:Uncharacterized protein n=1 Tax=Rhizobium mesosinicum TaxID=335017 RepID=A0ABS7H3F2_9HYPH|nr:hypothetical protein [Rhizobium mesosinicum]MBW9056035.1 hypothetical protein [Rhizobium mesosinicum]
MIEQAGKNCFNGMLWRIQIIAEPRNVEGKGAASLRLLTNHCKARDVILGLVPRICASQLNV